MVYKGNLSEIIDISIIIIIHPLVLKFHWFLIYHLILIMRGYLKTFWPNIKILMSGIFQFEILVYISNWGHHCSTACL